MVIPAVFSATSTVCALLAGFVALLATSDLLAVVALVVAGLNVGVGFLTGYVALLEYNRRKARREESL